MEIASKLAEPYLSRSTPEGFEALLLPAFFLGYSTILFTNKGYLLGLGVVDKVVQSFLIGFLLTMLIHTVVTVFTGEAESVETTRHTIQVSLMLACTVTFALIFGKPA